ncbi:hypothetical protein EVJ27_11630 [Exiguobacterium sp. SH3S2]|uniref:hypothetical protein n=1 Tax=unclassified Exiguobacterium TaxID=2644629 RepID=UPI00103D53E4|nr:MULTISPECIES: hypothetical protein [unclassified Exiguobacterium]TCI42888.1 hypothetical protein EVJ28_11650 [Exiguobacterium sp. SH3S3]TCI58641.1 hypothetical protein EVJ27_11630 [Exiguobacterium sp. SH3S2]
MNKHERLKKMIKGNRKWLLVRLGFAIPIGVLLFFFLQTETHALLYGSLMIASLLAYGVMIVRESRFMSSFTDHIRAKRVIHIQYVFDYMMVVFICLFFPLLLKLETISWVPYFVFSLTALALVLVERLLDEKVKLIDPEQPTRRDVKRESF